MKKFVVLLMLISVLASGCSAMKGEEFNKRVKKESDTFNKEKDYSKFKDVFGEPEESFGKNFHHYVICEKEQIDQEVLDTQSYLSGLTLGLSELLFMPLVDNKTQECPKTLDVVVVINYLTNKIKTIVNYKDFLRYESIFDARQEYLFNVAAKYVDKENMGFVMQDGNGWVFYYKNSLKYEGNKIKVKLKRILSSNGSVQYSRLEEEDFAKEIMTSMTFNLEDETASTSTILLVVRSGSIVKKSRGFMNEDIFEGTTTFNLLQRLKLIVLKKHFDIDFKNTEEDYDYDNMENQDKSELRL